MNLFENLQSLTESDEIESTLKYESRRLSQIAGDAKYYAKCLGVLTTNGGLEKLNKELFKNNPHESIESAIEELTGIIEVAVRNDTDDCVRNLYSVIDYEYEEDYED